MYGLRVIKTDAITLVSHSLNLYLYHSNIPVILRPECDLGNTKLTIVNIHDLHVLKLSRSSQKADPPLLVCS